MVDESDLEEAIISKEHNKSKKETNTIKLNCKKYTNWLVKSC